MPVADTDETVERNLMILNAMMTKWVIKMNCGETIRQWQSKGEGCVMVSVKGVRIEEVSGV